MSKPYPKYDEEFKKNLVELHKNGKSQIQLHNEYGVSHSALSKWIKQYSEVKISKDTPKPLDGRTKQAKLLRSHRR